VLLTANSAKEFGDKARLQHLATTVLGELYANRDAHCDEHGRAALGNYGK
jgi:hypothetical protein